MEAETNIPSLFLIFNDMYISLVSLCDQGWEHWAEILRRLTDNSMYTDRPAGSRSDEKVHETHRVNEMKDI
jgi:hypothetical protein